MVDVPRRPMPVAHNGSGRLFGAAEEAEVLDVLRSGALARWDGTKVDALETAWAAKLGVRHAVAVASGTAAVHVAVAAFDLEPGTEVITSPISDMGTVVAIIAAGLVPVFADVDRLTGMMTPESAERRVGPRTGALLPVHLFGRFAQVHELRSLAERHGLALVEDASQAHFTSVDGIFAGTVGHVGCFSLQQTKVVSCGEGGIVTTNDDATAERVRLFQNKGSARTGPSGRVYPFIGLNYRMPELSAAVAGAQLRRADEIVARRAHSMGIVLDLTRDVAGLQMPQVAVGESVSWWALPAQFPDLADIDALRRLAADLGDAGLPFGVGHTGEEPLYLLESMRNKKTQGTARLPWSLRTPEVEYQRDDCPEAEWYLRHTVTMNWNEGITDDDARYVAAALERAAARGAAG